MGKERIVKEPTLGRKCPAMEKQVTGKRAKAKKGEVKNPQLMEPFKAVKFRRLGSEWKKREKRLKRGDWRQPYRREVAVRRQGNAGVRSLKGKVPLSRRLDTLDTTTLKVSNFYMRE